MSSPSINQKFKLHSSVLLCVNNTYTIVLTFRNFEGFLFQKFGGKIIHFHYTTKFNPQQILLCGIVIFCRRTLGSNIFVWCNISRSSQFLDHPPKLLIEYLNTHYLTDLIQASYTCGDQRLK